MRALFTSMLTLLIFSSHAQVKSRQSVTDKTIVKKYAALITPQGAKEQLTIIAGDEMEGRETGTRGQERAAAYIITQFKEAGLRAGVNGNWEQHYPLYRDSLEQGVITCGEHTFQFGTDFYAGIQETGNVDITAAAVFAGYGIVTPVQDDYQGLDVKDKIVIVREGIPAGVPRDRGNAVEKAAVAGAHGARAIIVISVGASRFRSLDQQYIRKTGIYTRRDSSHNRPDVFYITPAAAGKIMGIADVNAVLADRGGQKLPAVINTPVHILFQKKDMTMWPSNVLGYLEGTDKKEEVVFITAHYDHLGTEDNLVYYGADDDGSGTTAVIAMAKAFGAAKKAGHGPRRSIVFMTVSGEEKGLLGSEYYTGHPVYPLANTVADLNIDMIGRIDPAHQHDTNYVYLIGDNKLSSELRPVSENANNTFTHFNLDYKYNDPNDPHQFYYRSDHYNFARHKVPVIFYFNGTHADYHKPTDTVDKINFNLLARRAQLVFYTAWDIANRDTRLVIDRSEK